MLSGPVADLLARASSLLAG